MKLIVLTVFFVGLIAPTLCRTPIFDINYYAHKYNRDVETFVADTDIIERFYPQRVDHFNPGDTRNFLQRYYSIENYYQIGGPVFIFIGGFQPLESNVHFNYTFVRDLAIAHGGMVYAIENRFFGLSRPTGDLSLESLRLLTIEQSLRDYAVLITFIKEYVALANSFRIFIGGTDSGATLATWIAQAYPNLATGTWASSAPLEAGIEFSNYFNDVGKTLKRVDSNCYDKVEEAFAEIDQIFENGTTEVLEELFRLEYPINMSDDRDKNTFYATISLYLAKVVELYDDVTIEGVCDNYFENDNATALEGFASFIHGIYEEVYPDFRINTNFESLVSVYKDPSWSSLGALGARQMFYIACNQFSLFETSRVQPTPFGDHVPLSFYTELCRAVYSDTLTDDYIATQNEFTNAKYGGKSPSGRYICFTNGGNDPYRLQGLVADLNIYSPTVVIPNYGKSRDFLAESPDDSAELKVARQILHELIGG